MTNECTDWVMQKLFHVLSPIKGYWSLSKWGWEGRTGGGERDGGEEERRRRRGEEETRRRREEKKEEEDEE